MKFGVFFLHHVPRPWTTDSETRTMREALEQVELADRLGFDTAWATEHHFLEEYSHSAAPELFLAAASQRTTRIRLGHGIVALPPAYNHPARVAERAAVLDILSGGRVELGTGETSSTVELEGFGIDRAVKREMWEEALEVVGRMMTEEPFRGVDGTYLQIPPRNVVPKPIQRPHPPLWVACSRRDTIALAARKGIGALTFAFLDAPEAAEWVDAYYTTLRAEGNPIGEAVNPNVAVVSSLMCHEDEQQAIDRGIDGPHFFAYSLAHYYIFGSHRPSGTELWQEFLANRELAGMSRSIIRATGAPLTAKVRAAGGDSDDFQKVIESQRGAIGTPDQIRDFLRTYEGAGVDQIIFNLSTGITAHEDVCASLELFAREVMPEFVERQPDLEAAKAKRLEPVLAEVMARKIRATATVPEGYAVAATPAM